MSHYCHNDNTRSTRPTAALLVGVAALVGLAAPAAHAAPEVAPRLGLGLEARLESGTGDTSGLGLGLLRLGVRWRLSPTLALEAGALGLLPLGSPTDDGRDAYGGVGGEVGLVLTPFPDWAVRPRLRWSTGLLFFPRADPFLPGGDLYEGVLTWGLGAEVAVGAGTLGLEVHYVHLSNGQGLGAHNPAFDGVGGALALTWPLVAPTPVPDAWAEVPARAGARRAALPGLQLDGAFGSVDEARLFSGRLQLAQRLGDALLAALDVEAGALAEAAFVEAGLALVAHLRPASFALHVGQRAWAGFDVTVAALQLEAHATREVSFVALGHVELPADGDVLWRAAVGLRTFPARSLLLELGVGFDRIGAPTLGDGSDPYLSIEWRLPLGLEDAHLALFLERQVSTVDTLGLRFAWNLGTDVRDAVRHDGWRRVR